MTAVFYYDFSSPYAYLAACRVDEVLPERPEWRPISFGVIVRSVGKVPWSFKENRREQFDAIERRARERGLPAVSYPDGWPVETYSLKPLRAAMLAEDQEQLRRLSHEMFRTMFVDGQHLADTEAVIRAAERAGLAPAEVRDGIERPDIKERLKAQTDAALGRGVTGVPTVEVDGQLFWGDDRLEDAAAAAG